MKLTTTSGAQALIEMLVAAGVRYLFGNPGTTELPLMDALAADRRLQYLLGLQEVPVVAMADGYAQASRSLGVVNLHISCGLGNGMGMLYNAYRAGTPLLVTAGQQDRRLKFEEPILWSDMVSVVRPWTKWAAEIERLEDLPSAVRRAMQTALTPPTGPVFLSLPIDLQSEVGQLDLTLPSLPDPRVRPPRSALRRAAELLATTR
ncbi:MAG TPA: thiamine pyrophosphate-binding protein, partial [Pirellulales bacterium]|nr:thiamine pyrophosphate-binding protein [Pirellulales bacterium]